jgi:exo-1,4-beta-D-glucosaminidase
VFAPVPIDLQTTWVDWNPSPPDKDMGLWRPVYLSSSGPVVVRNAFVSSHVAANAGTAELTVNAHVRNLTSREATGTLRGRIGDVAFRRSVTLAPHDSTFVQFTPDSFPQLRISQPQLWWPAELGKPVLHTLDIAFATSDVVSDRQRIRFGIREVTSEFTPRGRLFRINGRRILIRGGGWAQDMFFRYQPARLDAQLRYAQDMHLNTIRLEGNYEDDHFFQRTDSLGILVMTGWVCCSAWEEWRKWTPEQYQIAAASQRDQARRLAAHPSVFVWLYGSDNPPPADVEKLYLDILQQERWPNPVVSSASAKPAQVTGASGVKMTGPYDWVPPSYWLQDTAHGGAWGYNTETSPGAAVPPIESMKRMLPTHDFWPLDSVWAYHGAGGQFNKASRFNVALAARFGEPASAEDYTFKSQLMTYEGERAMFEAYRRNAYVSTGIIQWMLNNAWPSIFWHLFDWYLRPGGGYFGAKKANEPVHVLYSYDDSSAAVVNATDQSIPGARLHVRVLNLDGAQQFARDTTIDVAADSSMRILRVPQISTLSATYFLDLRLDDPDGKPLSRNFYWLSTHPDVLNLDSTTWYVTPVRSYADFKALQQLPAQPITSSAVFGLGTAHVTVTNPGPGLAFFVRLQILGAGGEEVLPVVWEDNYVTLLPGETRSIAASYAQRDLRGARPKLRVTGWNLNSR